MRKIPPQRGLLEPILLGLSYPKGASSVGVLKQGLRVPEPHRIDPSPGPAVTGASVSQLRGCFWAGREGDCDGDKVPESSY